MKYCAILGFGTVGSGVAEVLCNRANRLSVMAGDELVLKRIVDIRSQPDSPFAELITPDFSLVELDPEITLVAETIGGTGIALEYTRRCLLAGKSVVTSNKQLVAEYGPELVRIALEHGCSYLFEASVGGGIPCLATIRGGLCGNRIEEVYGILNGTTNYILTRMFRDGIPFEEALASAQKKGYAERNPQSDLSGADTCRKLSILCAMCFGMHVYPQNIPTDGIENVTARDARLAERISCEIRLLGRAVRTEHGIAAGVSPYLVPCGSLISSVNGVTNALVVRGDAVGEVEFRGPGAGKLPTASAVAADLADAARHPGGEEYPLWEDEDPASVSDIGSIPSEWYVRSSASAPEGSRSIDDDVWLTPALTEKELKAQIDAGAVCFRVLGTLRRG